jgi:hypothetical protein
MSGNALHPTANNYLKAIPYSTKPGDCILVLAGGKFPYVF